jgi:hypothetical protein
MSFTTNFHLSMLIGQFYSCFVHQFMAIIVNISLLATLHTTQNLCTIVNSQGVQGMSKISCNLAHKTIESLHKWGCAMCKQALL